MYLPGGLTARNLPKFDWTSFALLCATIVLLLTVGSNGQRMGWVSNSLILLTMIGLGTGTLFVWLQLKSASPLLDFSLFKNAQFASAVAVGFVFGIGNFASNYVVPVFLQQVQGFTAGLSGMVLVPAGILVISTTPLFGRLTDRFPAHILVMIGIVMFACGNFLMSGADVNTTFWTFAAYIIVARFGMAMIMPSLSASALRALTPEQLNKGSGTVNFCRQFGGAVGITSFVVFAEQRTQFHGEALTATQTPDNAVSQQMLDQVGTIMGEAGLPGGPAPVGRAALSRIGDRSAGADVGLPGRVYHDLDRIRAGAYPGLDSGPGETDEPVVGGTCSLENFEPSRLRVCPSGAICQPCSRPC